MTSTQRTKRNYRAAAAAVGAGVLVAMGAITVGVQSDSLTLSEAPTGDSSTPTTPPKSPETSKATPSVTASTSQGEWPETSHATPSP